MMKRIITICAAAIISISAIFAQSNLQPLATIKLNKAKSEVITIKVLKARCDVYKKQFNTQSFTLDQKKEILNNLIDEKLILQAAAKAGISITDSQLYELYLNNLSQQVGRKITEQEFASMVKQETGLSLDEFFQNQLAMTVEEYKTFLKNQYIGQQYVIRLKQAEMQAIAATDTEIRSYFEMNRTTFTQNDIMKLFLVVVPKGNDAAKAKAKADEVYAKLSAKKPDLNAIKAGMNADTPYQAGDMLVSKNTQAAAQLRIDYNTMLKIIDMSIGDVSKINESPNDFQFYLVQERYPAKMLELSDVVQPGSTTTVYETIRAYLSQQKQMEYYNKAVKEIAESLRTPDSYQMNKTGDELDKLLENW